MSTPQPLSDAEVEHATTDASTRMMWEELGDEESAIARDVLVSAERARQAGIDPGDALIEGATRVYHLLNVRGKAAAFVSQMSEAMLSDDCGGASQPHAGELPVDRPIPELYQG